jgi:hypothetical protein
MESTFITMHDEEDMKELGTCQFFTLNGWIVHLLMDGCDGASLYGVSICGSRKDYYYY